MPKARAVVPNLEKMVWKCKEDVPWVLNRIIFLKFKKKFRGKRYAFV